MKPIFSDCAFPRDCECAKRGYEHELDRCAVPRVRQAAADLLRETTTPGEPRIASVPGGAVMVLGVSGDFASDVIEAAGWMGCNLTLSRDDVAKLIGREKEGMGLRAEAGLASGPFVLVLKERIETLASGTRIGCWLILSQTSIGDALLWNVSTIPGGPVVRCPTTADRDNLLELLRAVAGSPSSAVEEWEGEAP